MNDSATTEHIIADMGASDRPNDPPDVSSVFGTPYEVEGKTLIPVASVQHIVAGYKGETRWSGAKAKAVIEVSDGNVRVVDVVDPVQLALPGMAVSAWHLYWILKTVRALMGKR
jgi:hypothetical protein